MPPAARVTDMHVCPMVTVLVPHVGGPILPPGVPTVLIGMLPAATVTDMLTCVGPPDVIIMGSVGVLINFLPAARMGDPTAHGGVIILGEPTVMIGEMGAPSPGAGGLGGVIAGLVASGIALVAEAVKSLYAAAGSKGGDDAAAKLQRQQGAARVWPGQQNYDNCGVQSAGQIIAAVSGSKPDEVTLLNKTVSDGNSGATGGTNPSQRQAILASNNIPSTVEPTTRDNLADAIKGNKGIIANVDAGVLWDDPQYLGGGHAVLVYDGDFDAQGNLTDVYINDTGAGVQGRKLPIDTFMDAADARNPSSLNVTDNPVW